MKRILLILSLCFLGYGISYAGDAYQVWASTSYATLCNSSCRVDTLSVESSTNTPQTVIFYNDTTEKWRVSVNAYVPATGVSRENVHIGSYMRFPTNCRVKCTDTYGNNKVKVQINVE